MRRPLALLALCALVVLAACGGDDTSVSTEPTGSAGGDGPGAGPTPPAADEVAIQITVGGGFTPFGYDFAQVPTVVLGDGTAFTAGAMTAIFPGPALQPVFTGTLPASAVADLLADAADAGLTAEEPLDVGEPPVADAATTTITITADGRTTTRSVYALDLPGEGAGALPGVSEDQQATRDAVAGFVAAVRDAVADVATEPFAPTTYQALPLVLEGQGDLEVTPNELTWPLADQPLSTEQACTTVAGAAAEQLAELLPEATQITRWTDPSSGTVFQIAFRTVLPGTDPIDC